MFSPTLHSATRRGVAIAIGCALIILSIGTLAFAEVYVVAGRDDSTLYGYDLNTSTFLGSASAGYHPYWVVVGPNPRLVFSGCVYYVSVVDVTIGREIKRIYGVYPSTGAPTFSQDGKWLLFQDTGNYTLDIVDVATLRLVRSVRLSGAMGFGVQEPGAVVVVGHKAYATTYFTDSGRPGIAVVDLRTFKARRIATPDGYFDGIQYSSPNAAATADGRYVVVAQTSNVDGSYHLLFIDTRTDQLVLDDPIATDPYGLAISPVASPAYGYLIGDDPNLGSSVTAIDLNSGSPTFGQLLPQTGVDLNVVNIFYCSGVSLNRDGSKMVVAAWRSSTQGPQPNALVVDTGLMFTDPTHALIGQVTAGNGERTGGVAVGSLTSTPPPTAPTVTGVIGSVTNDTATTIHVTGTNFMAGAQVRIGNMVPLPATVNRSTDLQVTVPKHAPAGPNQDVIVTNPLTTSPPAEQNQSGRLPGGLTILLNPAFQPNYQFAALDFGNDTISTYDFNQRAMVQPTLSSAATSGIVFNFDGQELYSGSLVAFWRRVPQMLAVDLTTESQEATIPLSGVAALGSYNTMVASVNPANGSPVVYVPTRSGGDLVIYMIDTNPSSPTFNTVIQTSPAMLGASPIIYSAAASSSGEFVYVNIFDGSDGFYKIAIVDVMNPFNTHLITTDMLGVQAAQTNTYVTPDGKYLLLAGKFGGIAVFNIYQHPFNPTLLVQINGTPPPQPGGTGPNYFYGYQVVGGQILVGYTINQVVVFNFNPDGFDFSQLNSYSLANAGLVTGGGSPFFAVSPDGAHIYVQPGGEDEITVLDGNALLARQPPLLTKLAAGRRPWFMAISPVAHSSKQKASAPIDGTPSGQSGNRPAGIPHPPARERLQSSHDARGHNNANSQ